MKTTIFLILALSLAVHCQAPAKKIEITMFIESLCPDCTRSVSQSFGPAFDKGLLDMADVTFVPYGKMEQTYNSETKLYEYTCQHGPAECWGNTFQTCLLNGLKDEPRKALDLMVCIYSFADCKNRDFSHALITCTTSANVDVLDQAKKCSHDYDQWQPLMKQNAELTPGYPQKIDHVPFVNVDGKHSEQEEENAIIGDVFKWACENYTGTDKPELCGAKSLSVIVE